MDIAKIRKKAKKKEETSGAKKSGEDSPVKDSTSSTDKDKDPVRGEASPLGMEEVEIPTEEAYEKSLEKEEEGVKEEKREVLSFFLGDEEFAIDVMELKEIIKPREILEVPGTPPSVKGIIFLRGEVIPIIDLRERLGLPQKGIDRDTRFVLAGSDEGEKVGLIVDRVKQVLKIPEKDIESPPSVKEGIDVGSIEGIGHLDRRLIAILKLSEVLKVGKGCNEWEGSKDLGGFETGDEGKRR